MRHQPPVPPTLSASRRKPLAACVAALFALAVPEAFAANTLFVTTCADSGVGSLRAAVANSGSGDTVDFSQLNSTNCPSSTISLTTGAIAIGQALTLAGRTTGPRITISGYYNGTYQNDRLIKHTMPGSQLSISNLNFEYSKFSPASGNALGGCIYSAGSVSLSNVTVFHCQATAAGTSKALGGGIYANGDVSMKYSRIVGNSVTSPGNAPIGGGVVTRGAFSATASSIDHNGAMFGSDGGVDALKGASLISSTISGNTAGFAAGMYVSGYAGTSTRIVDSTISGNVASSAVGGIFTSTPTVTVSNSTLAFNTAVDATPDQAAGFYILNTSGTAFTVNLQSSIFSNNTYGATENDFGARAVKAGSAFTVTSNNNIIRASLGATRPATVTIACPLLGPLRDNGGSTLTHALMSHSPAIDSGNNNASLNQDQRGLPFGSTPFPYPRQSGIAPDIGAYEVQQNDVIFNTGFEGCPVLF